MRYILDMSIDYSPLKQLGLSAGAIACYEKLYGNGWIIASELARRTHLSASRVYEIVQQLETWGFVTSFDVGIGPCYYSAQPLETALANYHAFQRKQFNVLMRRQQSHFRLR